MKSTLCGLVVAVFFLAGVLLAQGGEVPKSEALMLIGPNSHVAQKAKISGGNVMLLGQNGKWLPAPDGTYTTGDGRKIIVVNGSISRKKDAAPPKEGTAEGQLRRALKGTE